MAHKYTPSIGEASKIPLNIDAEISSESHRRADKVVSGQLGSQWLRCVPLFISGMIDVRDGSIKNRYGTQLKNDETWTIPPGSATVIEVVFPEEGVYVGVHYNMSHVLKVGAFLQSSLQTKRLTTTT
jgi:hypothetical protein